MKNEITEFKKTLGQLKDGIISIAAILNKHGQGELWFGIRDDGIPVGINVGTKTIRDISQAIAAHIDPKIYPEITTEQVEGLPCVKVLFSEQDAPYSAYGRPYIRVGDEDRRLSAQELQHFIVRKQRSALRWDSEPGRMVLADMDTKKVRAFVERAGLKWYSLHSAMENLGLLVEDKLMNTAPLFFSKKPMLKLRCAVFGTDTTSFIIDRQDVDGDILELVEDAQKYILKNIHMGMRLEGLYRVDVPEIAIPAIREAIINAFCHRDYRDPEYVQVAIFKNRVEIRNPGMLFGGLTIESLRQGKLSRRRNPLIAQMLTRIHMMESWGRGMSLILENEPSVQFEELAGMFITVFGRSGASSIDTASVEEQRTPATGEPSITTGETTEKNLKTTGETTGEPSTTTGETTAKTPTTTGETPGKELGTLTKQEKIVLQLIVETPKISHREIAVKMRLTEDGVRYHTRKLRKKGRLRRIGSTKGGAWEVVHES